MREVNVFAKNRKLAASVACTVVEGLLDGCNFMLIYLVIKEVFADSFNLDAVLGLTGALVAIFAVRLVVYGWGYVQGQIGGAQVSRTIRIYLGDKIKRIPLARFSERTSGDYLGALTSNVNDYEQILTHKTGSIVKNIALGIMLVGFVTWLYPPAGAIVALMFLLIVPGLAYAWRQVRKFGVRKSAVQASNTSKDPACKRCAPTVSAASTTRPSSRACAPTPRCPTATRRRSRLPAPWCSRSSGWGFPRSCSCAAAPGSRARSTWCPCS